MLALTAAATGLLAAPVAMASDKALTGEQQLAKLLEGRTPGKPDDCISLFTSHDSTVIDKTAIVYGRGTTIYVNTPSDAKSLNSDDIQVVNLTGSQLCRLDIVHTVDRSSHMQKGFIGLEQFVPWTRVAKPASATATPAKL